MTSPSGFTTSMPQSGQRVGIWKGFVPRGAPAPAADDLWDHVPGPLHDRRVALADVLPVDVLLVVERRPRDGDAADLHGLEHGPRVEPAGTTDPDQDLEQLVWAVIGAHL